jgi:hypothetical protein
MDRDQLGHWANSHPPQAVQHLLKEGEVRSLTLSNRPSSRSSFRRHSICRTAIVVDLFGCLDVQAADLRHVRSCGVV